MKKLLSILLIIMLIITFIQIRNMYALYKDKLSGEYVTSLGKWNVEVNGTDIVKPGEVVEFEMLDGNIEYLDNAFKSEGAAIVPNTEAFFDILFNTTGSDVAVKYIIEFGEINSYNVINKETGEYVVDTTDDKIVDIEDETVVEGEESEAEVGENTGAEEAPVVEETFDNSPDDYEFALKYPLKFEIQDMQQFFGEYSISPEEENKGKITGTDSEEEFEMKIKCEPGEAKVSGVIPLEVTAANLQSKVRVKFKWILDEDEIAEENKKEYEEMYQLMTSRNNEKEAVKLIMPIKVKAIQYFGEDL